MTSCARQQGRLAKMATPTARAFGTMMTGPGTRWADRLHADSLRKQRSRIDTQPGFLYNMLINAPTWGLSLRYVYVDSLNSGPCPTHLAVPRCRDLAVDFSSHRDCNLGQSCDFGMRCNPATRFLWAQARHGAGKSLVCWVDKRYERSSQ